MNSSIGSLVSGDIPNNGADTTGNADFGNRGIKY